MIEEASQSIIGEALIEGGIGTDVHFHAGDKIVLRPGFKTSPESIFRAKLTACGTPKN